MTPHSYTTPKVPLVNGATMSTLLCQPGIKFSLLSLREILVSPTTENPDLQAVPPEYHEFAKVFSKEEADKLPPHCHDTFALSVVLDMVSCIDR